MRAEVNPAACCLPPFAVKFLPHCGPAAYCHARLAPTIPGMTNPMDQSEMAEIPLFPLPNVVLFPHAVLPLHIFEARYKVMVADALRGSRRIAMALLQPG